MCPRSLFPCYAAFPAATGGKFYLPWKRLLGHTVASVHCFLFPLPNNIHLYSIHCTFFNHTLNLPSTSLVSASFLSQGIFELNLLEVILDKNGGKSIRRTLDSPKRRGGNPICPTNSTFWTKGPAPPCNK